MATVRKRRWKYNGAIKEAWVVRYLDRGGCHRSRQFDRKGLADEYRRQVENELHEGTHVARRDSRTVKNLIAEFKVDVERRQADGTVGRGYMDLTCQTMKYVEPVIGNILVRDLRWQDVEYLYGEMRKVITRFGRPLAPRTLHNILKLLGTVVSYGVRRGYAARNVVPDAIREIGTKKGASIETFSREEVKRLLVALENPPPGTHKRTQLQIKAMVYLAVVCGLRLGEVRGLTMAHLDLDRGVVHVRQSLDAWDEIKLPKTAAGVRSVPMPAPVVAVVRAYAAEATTDARGLIFRGRGGAPLWIQSFRTIWTALLLRAGFPPRQSGNWRHFHALRHFAGSAWLEAGVPLAEVSRLLGHAHVGITAEVYSHAIVGTLERSSEISMAACALLPPPVAQELRKRA